MRNAWTAPTRKPGARRSGGRASLSGLGDAAGARADARCAANLRTVGKA